MNLVPRHRICAVLAAVVNVYGASTPSVASATQAGKTSLAASPAALDLELDQGAALLFPSVALRDAIAVRLNGVDVAGPVKVSVNRAGAERLVRISVGDRRCEAPLDESQTSPESLRIVALLAADLIESNGVIQVIEIHPVHNWGLGVDGLGSPAGSWGDGRFEVHITLKRRLTSRLWATLGFAYGQVAGFPVATTSASETTPEALVPDPVVESLPVKLGVAKTTDWGEVAAAAVARLYRVGDVGGTVFGGWLDVRPELLSGSLGKLAAVFALEAATQRVEVRPFGRDAVFASGYLTPWLGLALASP